jgi:crotonobetainyl-CoA:carnitine CoA-transferase CaiB-like acyl-CoA transferase
MGALSHLRVVELGGGVTAPFCARLFADLGAQVVKVEPANGDESRRWEPLFTGDDGCEHSAMFHYLNAGKESLSLDPDQAEDVQFLHTLLRSADVLVENLSPAQLAVWQLDTENLAERYPHLVHTSISPYGRTGPWADRPGTDLTVQAGSSLTVALGMPGDDPLCLPFDQAQYQAAFHGFAAALCALYERESSGEGQSIDISALQVLGYLVGGMSLVTAKRKIKWQKAGTRLKGGIYPTGLFECADGYICVATQHARQWKLFIDLMGNPDWAEDDKQADAFYLGNVEEEGVEVGDIAFRTWLKQQTRTELLGVAREHNIILGEVKKSNEVLDSAQFAHRDFWATLDVAGVELKIPKLGYQFEKTPVAIETAGPALGSLGASFREAPPAPIEMTRGERRSNALAGVRVLDFGWNWAGPMAGQLLADMGAEVIRPETVGRQDNMRAMDYASWFFCHNNRSKMSACFNIAKPEGSALVRKLVSRCDVVMDNFAVGVMAKNGLGYEALKGANPDIVAVSMSMAGQQGPERGMRGFASTASAYAGMEGYVGYQKGGDRGEDQTVGFLPFGLGDTTQAIQGAIATLVALLHRKRTGEGQFVDMSLNESMTATLGLPLLDYQIKQQVAGPQGTSHRVYFPNGLYRCRGEDHWLALSVRSSREWQSLCQAMGLDHLGADSSLQDVQARRERGSEIENAIAQWCANHDRDVATQLLIDTGVPAAPQLEIDERDAHPVSTARDFTYRHDQGSFVPCRIYNTPWLLSRTPPRVQRHAPALGEHNDYVYRDLLGLSSDQVDEFNASEVLV